MNRKTILILGAILGVLACCGAVAIWGIYTILNNPSIKQGLDAAGAELGAMMDLRQKVIDTYECEDVGVKLVNGNSLNVSLINSEFMDLSNSQQAERAREIAVFVKDNYTGNANISYIIIAFVENKQIGPLKANRTFNYPFEVSSLK